MFSAHRRRREKQLYLLSSEIVSYEVLLQLLIGVVDAQLLKVIDAKALEAVHVQNACKREMLIKVRRRAETPVEPGLPMKLVHADASAQMLLLMKATSHSNSLSGEASRWRTHNVGLWMLLALVAEERVALTGRR